MATIGRDTTITWLGHGTFHITTPGGRRLLIDPWIHENPAWPTEWTPRILHEGLDAIFMTHGHFDHLPDLFAMVQETKAKVACIFDMAGWLVSKDIPEDRIIGFNKGGTIEVAGIRATMTTAQHSSAYNDNGTLINLGEDR